MSLRARIDSSGYESLMSKQNSMTDRVWNVSFIPSSHESSISCSVSFMGSLAVSGWHSDWNGIWIQQYFDQSSAGKYDARCSCKRPRWFRIIWVDGSMSSLSLMKLFRLLKASNLPLIKLSCQNCAFLSKARILLLSKRMCLLFPWRLVFSSLSLANISAKYATRHICSFFKIAIFFFSYLGCPATPFCILRDPKKGRDPQFGKPWSMLYGYHIWSDIPLIQGKDHDDLHEGHQRSDS